MIDAEAVGALVRTVSREEILSRFRKLRAEEIHTKPTEDDVGDVVTEADLAAERRLTTALTALLPGSIVVGEEATAADPALLASAAASGPVWLVDPLDGTRNFAAGLETFGSMVALAVDGDVRWSWIYLPVEDALFAAALGGGATLNGAIVRAASRPAPAPRGTLYTRFMPHALRSEVERAATATTLVEGPGCACLEYTGLVRGAKDYVVFHRLLPWDHAPGALLLTEAGGGCRFSDGEPYRLGVETGPLLLTREAGAWPQLAGMLFGR